MTKEMTVLYADSSAIIFESDLRRFPSIAIQGDKLGLLAYHVSELQKALASTPLDDDSREHLDYIANLAAHLNSLYKEHATKD